MPEHKEQEEIKVVDRRMFNPDGSLRDDIIVTDEPVPVAAAAAAEAAMPTPVAASQAAPQAEPEPADDEEMSGEEPEMNEFMEFLMQVGSSAFIYLGMMEHPATGTRQLNLPAAKQSIDMLVLLRQKTSGNLTPDETRFFDGLLSDLQMQYVSLSNRMGMR